MKKLIYIAGSGHSGSTLLDLLLSAHPNVLGLGEACLLRKSTSRERFRSEAQPCSCGEKLEKCEFWSEMINYCEKNSEVTLGNYYSKLLQTAEMVNGKNTIISDSSKYVWHLRHLVSELKSGGIPGYSVEDLIVIHLLKDVRAYAVSVRRSRQLSIFQLIKRRVFSKWVEENREIEKYLNAEGLDNLRISYENLCLNTDVVLNRIWSSLGLDQSSGVDLDHRKGHIGVGNPMRNDSSKSKEISYDSRWFYDDGVALLYQLLPRIKSKNRNLLGPTLTFRQGEKLFELEKSS